MPKSDGPRAETDVLLNPKLVRDSYGARRCPYAAEAFSPGPARAAKSRQWSPLSPGRFGTPKLNPKLVPKLVPDRVGPIMTQGD
jgi:hypothetical protein